MTKHAEKFNIIFLRLKRKNPRQLSVTTFSPVGSINAKERKENGSESIVIDYDTVNYNRITSRGTERQKVQLKLEWVELNAEKSGQWRGVHNVFNDLNRSIVGVIHDCCEKHPKLEHEWGSLLGVPEIASKECTRVGIAKHTYGDFLCEKCKHMRNNVGNRNTANWLRRKVKDIQQLFS